MLRKVTFACTCPQLKSQKESQDWKVRVDWVGWLSPFSRLSNLSLFLSPSLRFGFVAMFSQHLWPASGIIARLSSPFMPTMLARLVPQARRLRFVGPVIAYLFPEEEGPRPNQRDGVPEVRIDAESIGLLCVALRDAVQEGLRAADYNSML